MREFMIELLALSLLMSALIGALHLMKGKISKKFSAACRYVIWLAVILRLAIPFGSGILPSVVSIPANEEKVYALEEHSAENQKAPAVSRPQSDAVLPLGGAESAESIMPNTSTSHEASVESTSQSKAAEKGASPMIDTRLFATIIFTVWAVGALAFFAVNIIKYNIYMARLKREISPADGRILSLYRDLCSELCIERIPELCISSGVQSPMLCGYFSKRIVLPPIELPDSAFRAVAAHELCHYRRGDIWVKLIALIANSLHWFNPLAYRAVKSLNCEMELSCDERVVRDLCEWERVCYGKAMLDIVSSSRGGNATLTTKFNPEKGGARERINNILDMTEKRRGAILIAITVAACIVMGALIGCEAASKKDTKENEDANALPSEETQLADEEKSIETVQGWTLKVESGELTLSKGDKLFTYKDYRGEEGMMAYGLVFDEKEEVSFVTNENEEYGAIIYSNPRYSVDQPKCDGVKIISLEDGRTVKSLGALSDWLPLEKILFAHGLEEDILSEYEYPESDSCLYRIDIKVSMLGNGVFSIDQFLTTADDILQLAGCYVYDPKEDLTGDYIPTETVYEKGKIRINDIMDIDALAYPIPSVVDAVKAFIAKDSDALEDMMHLERGVLEKYRDFTFGDYIIEVDKYGNLQLTVEILESSLDTVPPGDFVLTFYDGMAYTTINGLNPISNSQAGEGECFTDMWVMIMGDVYIPLGSEVEDTEEYHRACVDFLFQLLEERSPEEYKQAAEKILGIKDIKIPESFIAENGNVFVGGHGGRVKYYEVLSEETKGDSITVTIQTYADSMCTVKNRLIVNEYKKSGEYLCVVSSTVVEDRGYNEAGYCV